MEPTGGSFELMGVLNVTPDSFSDGGEWFSADAAVSHGLRMVGAGASLLDVGGESTRPGAAAVPVDEELARTLPVVAALARATSGEGGIVSIDTSKLVVAQAALDSGARYVNDVTALRGDPEMAGLIADRGVRCCLMHMLGEPRTMQDAPRYGDVVDEVRAFIEERAGFAVREGVAEEMIDVDPGIGFGKTVEHNLELLRRLDEIVAAGFRVMVGVSRKSFIGCITGVDDPRERVAGTVAANVLAYGRGARAFRVHDVAENAQALRLAQAALG